MTKEQAAIILQELVRRNKPLALLNETFEPQRKLIEDKSTLKAALCTRRSGKSVAAGLYLLREGLLTPGVSILYIALTRESAKRIMYKDVIKHLDKRFLLDLRYNETTLTVTFPNGSILYLLGMDSSPDEAEKALGQKFKLVVIDEAASFKQNLKHIVYSVLKPAVADYRGTILMIGTPGNNLNNLFYDVTSGKEPGWSVHKWTAFDNPYIKDAWKEEIDQLLSANPLIVQTPIYRQMYLGEWVIDTSKLVYKYNRDINLIDEIEGNQNEYLWILGVDLGYDDDTSFVVCGYRANDPTLYIVETAKHPGLIVERVAHFINHYVHRYNPFRMVIDGANKQVVEELKQRYQLPLISADKAGKADYIELMNSDFITGKIKLMRHATEPLQKEYENLIWDDTPKKQEHPLCPNHAADAALYAWRHTYNYTEKPKAIAIPKPEEKKIEEWEEQQSELLERQLNDPDNFY